MSNGECQGIPCFIEWGCGETPLFDRNNLYHYLTRALTNATWWWMIRGTRGKLARNAVRGLYGKGFPSDLVSRTRTILLALDSADSLEDLKFPPGNHLEQLGGDRKGLHSLRINSQWRICFLWTEKGPADVEIVDYH